MDLKFNFKLDPKVILPILRMAGPYLTGLAVIAVFGYTGWVINQAFNVEPAATSTIPPSKAVVFDKQAVTIVKNLQVVPGDVAPVPLGKTDPFGN
ncbi:MAG TPA: hypothetical protein VLF67_04225 [Candidatus Saccharimonas sp.]|nr:hypothetical protein [Candidatus Saccharimonas sp.]